MKEFKEYLIRIGKSENTALTYCRNIRMYFSWCRDSFGSEPKELYRSNVLEYISYMRNIRGYSPKSVNNHLSALRCLNKYLVQSGRQLDMAVLDSDFMKVQIQYASPCSVDKKEVEAFRQRMLESGSKRDFAIVTLLVYAGLRRSECVNLKLDQVDLIAKEIRVIGKGDKQRLVYINDRIAAAIREYLKERNADSPYLFASRQCAKLSAFGLIDDIDEALMNRSGKERLNAVNTVMIRCWEYIQDFCEVCKEHQEEAEAAGGTVTVAETLSEILSSIAGTSEVGSGSSTPVPETSGSTGESATAAARAETRSEAAESESGGENTSPQTESENNENASESGEASNQSDDSENAQPGGGGSGSGKQETSESEKGRIPHQQTDGVSAPVGGSVTKNSEYQREQYDRAASDIERILDNMAEKAACEELESERIRELNEAAQSISYGDIHSGVNIRVNRIASVDPELVEQYDAICNPLISISRQLQKSLLRQLKENRRGGKQTGLIMGRRLDAHALCRNDGKVFYKNNLPNEIPELAVGLLLDESGSMCSCDRCTYARAAAIILYDFCESLEIPVMVYGHSTDCYDGKNSVELYSYAEFNGFDNDDKYRLMDISARGSNRDGAALRYVAEALSKRSEAVKLLILVSDGQPADTGYYGTAAEEDLRGIKQEYQRKGILFVAAAIGNDKQNIERIYGDSFLDITDLNQLPTKLTGVVKRHIRV